MRTIPPEDAGAARAGGRDRGTPGGSRGDARGHPQRRGGRAGRRRPARRSGLHPQRQRPSLPGDDRSDGGRRGHAGADGTILFCNRRFAAMLRLPHAQVLGTPMVALLAPEYQAHFAELVVACRRDGMRNEVVLQAGDGTRVPVSLACSALPEGETESLCLVATDLTARYAAEAAIRRQNEELERRVQERTAELAKCTRSLRACCRKRRSASLAFNRDLRFVLVNERLAMNGLPSAFHIGKRIDEIVPSLAPTVEKVTARILATGQPVREHEFTGDLPLAPGVPRHWSANSYRWGNRGNYRFWCGGDGHHRAQAGRGGAAGERAAAADVLRVGGHRDVFLAPRRTDYRGQ